MSKALRGLLASSAIFGSALVSHAAVAQDAAAADDSASIGEIVVTAQRRSEALEKTPVAVSVVSADTLARQAITSERDLQFATPGLTVRARRK